MKKTVTLYEHIIIALGCSTRPVYLLWKRNHNPDYGIFYEGEQEYYVPDGYHIGETYYGIPEFYDANGDHCPLMTGDDDKPMIITRDGKCLYLDPVPEQQ